MASAGRETTPTPSTAARVRAVPWRTEREPPSATGAFIAQRVRSRRHVRRDVGVRVGRADRRQRDPPQRDVAAPDAGGDVVFLVERTPGALLHRRLPQREGEDGGRGQLLARRSPQRGGASRDHVVDDQVEGVRPLGRIVDGPGAADDHRGPVVHRVLHAAPRRDQTVQLGDGDAHVRGEGSAEPAGPGRAVQVERAVGVGPVRVDRERHRQHHGVGHPVAGHDRSEVGEQGIAEQRQHPAALGDGTVGLPGDGGPEGGRQRRHGTSLSNYWPAVTGHFSTISTGHSIGRTTRHSRSGSTATGPSLSAYSSRPRSATWCSPAPSPRRPAAQHPGAGRRPRGRAVGDRAGLRPAARRGLADRSARCRDVRGLRRRTAPRHPATGRPARRRPT